MDREKEVRNTSLDPTASASPVEAEGGVCRASTVSETPLAASLANPDQPFTPEEESGIEAALRDLLDTAAARGRFSKEQLALISKAFDVARKAHDRVRRKSGIPYIYHPVEVAKIVSALLPGDEIAIAAGLLHDVVEDTEVQLDEIAQEFGTEVANVVDGLTKIAGLSEKGESLQLENYMKLLSAMDSDVRVVYVKLADRLHNMRTLESMPDDKKRKITSETNFIYAPLAERLGLYSIRDDLLDLCLLHERPEQYRSIEEKLSQSGKANEERIRELSQPIAKYLKQYGLVPQITSRAKAISSIYRKMEKKHIPFEEVYDVMAMRVVFTPRPGIPERTQCWFIYQLITDLYTVMPERTRDWVTSPKTNGYEALHCTILTKEGSWLEVQIRTERMNRIAEEGNAAHWRYKEGLRAEQPGMNPREFIESFRNNVLSNQIVVLDRKNRKHTLPRNATVLDFAYDIAESLGNNSLGALLNGELINLDHPLRGGEKVEIIDAPSQRPSPKWLDFVRTTKASEAIARSLRAQAKALMDNGMLVFASIAKKAGYTLYRNDFAPLLRAFDLVDLRDLYTGLADGLVNYSALQRWLWWRKWAHRLGIVPRRGVALESPPLDRELALSTPRVAESAGHKKWDQATFQQVPCCYALPGDELLLFKAEEGQVYAHRVTCPEAIRLGAQRGNRVGASTWEPSDARLYSSYLFISGEDRVKLLADIFAALARNDQKVDITRVNLTSRDKVFKGVLSVKVKGLADLNADIEQVLQVPGVRRLYRLSGGEHSQD